MNYPGFIGSSAQVQSPVSDLERSVNLYEEPADVESGRPALYPTPGMRSFLAVADAGTRALRQMNSRTFTVIGGGIYELFPTMVSASYGRVTLDQNLAQIEFNGVVANQALIGSGTNGYLLNLTTNTLSQVLTGDCYQIGTLDSYFVAFNPVTGRIRISAAGDGTTWDPTQFQTRSQQPDSWKAMIVRAPDIWLIGDQSGDFWYDAGNFPFPFAPRTGFTHFYGIVAPFSLAASSRTVMWLSKNQDGIGLLVRADGYAPQPVGSYAFDAAMANYAATSRIDDAEGQMIQWSGHVWYVLRFPTANHTWAYDLRTGRLFELGHWNSARGDWDAWSPRAHCMSFGLHLVGDSSSQISVLDSTVGVEANGDPIRRLRMPPALIAANGSRVFVDRFELGMQPGLGTQFGQGANPTVMVRWSPDFGRTFGNEVQMAIGQVGQYSKQAYHGPVGSSLKALVPEVTFTDPVPFRLSGASVAARGVANAGTR